MNRMIFHHREFGVFTYRVGSVILHNNKILLCKFEKDNFWFLPGGRVDFFESSKKTLLRELKEELNEKAKIIRLLWLIEDLYTFRNKKTHEIQICYLVEFKKGSKIYSQQEFLSFENSGKLFFKWFDVKNLKKVDLRASFLKKELLNIDKNLKHIISPSLKNHSDAN